SGRCGAVIPSMRRVAVFGGLLLIVCAVAVTADSPAQILFDRLRARVRQDVANAPRYTFVETIERKRYRPQLGGPRSSCQAMIEARAQLESPGLEVWHDRLRLDVAVGEDSEMFSWAGAKQFETGDIQDLAASGSTGTGDFGAFLASVFGADGDRFRYNGEQETSLGRLAAFEYEVPLARSHYSYATSGRERTTVAYGGSFYAVPSTAELKRLVVDAHEFPAGDVCRVYDTIDYGRVKIGSGDFPLPEVSRMDVLYSTGQETINETHYAGCHEFTGEATIRFDDPDEAGTPAAAAKAALKALPPRTRIRVKIDPPISSETGAAGDAITGVVERDVKSKGQVVVRATDKLHGRILRMEQFLFPQARWVVAIRFDSIERDGVDQPVALVPADNEPRGPGLEHPAGSGLFLFQQAGRLVLDQKFRSEWETK
ncbi:MAG TPA: hypothetical protein VGF36_03810, partial [Rhodopila sp.]